MYESWIDEIDDELKKMRRFGCFVGSFSNPAAARKIQQTEDNENTRELDDEDYNKSLDYVKNYKDKKNTRRRHKSKNRQ
jgi:hypothetical protein